jgi:hypothetical protein
LLTEVGVDADAAGELDWVVSVDSSINRALQHAAGARRVVTTDPDQDTGIASKDPDSPAGQSPEPWGRRVVWNPPTTPSAAVGVALAANCT